MLHCQNDTQETQRDARTLSWPENSTLLSFQKCWQTSGSQPSSNDFRCSPWSGQQRPGVQEGLLPQIMWHLFRSSGSSSTTKLVSVSTRAVHWWQIIPSSSVSWQRIAVGISRPSSPDSMKDPEIQLELTCKDTGLDLSSCISLDIKLDQHLCCQGQIIHAPTPGQEQSIRGPSSPAMPRHHPSSPEPSTPELMDLGLLHLSVQEW